jgi:hypothetical protein
MLLLVGLLALASYFARTAPIGGWLMFFYLQTYAGIAFYIVAVGILFVQYPFLSSGSDALFLFGSVLHLIALLLVGGVATVALFGRKWFWVRNLQFALGVAIVLSLVSISVAAFQAPALVKARVVRFLYYGIWIAYFSQSARVRRVFIAHDREPVAGLR